MQLVERKLQTSECRRYFDWVDDSGNVIAEISLYSSGRMEFCQEDFETIIEGIGNQDGDLCAVVSCSEQLAVERHNLQSGYEVAVNKK